MKNTMIALAIFTVIGGGLYQVTTDANAKRATIEAANERRTANGEASNASFLQNYDPAELERQRQNESAANANASYAVAEAYREAEIIAARGKRPIVNSDGLVEGVLDYFWRTLSDYNSFQIVHIYAYEAYSDYAWSQTVRFRAKNGLGAYVITEWTFVFKHGKIIMVQ